MVCKWIHLGSAVYLTIYFNYFTCWTFLSLQAIFHVDDAPLNILQFASKSLHGFYFTSEQGSPIKCRNRFNLTTHPPESSLSFSGEFDSYIYLRLPPDSIFEQVPPQFSFVYDAASKETDQLLLILYHSIADLHRLLAIELRSGSPWLVIGGAKRAYRIPATSNQLTLQSACLGSTKCVVSLNGLSFLLRVDEGRFVEVTEQKRAADRLTDWQGMLEPLGSNVSIGGSNWTEEAELARLPSELWSGLGRRSNFVGCIHRWIHLSSMSIDF